MEGFSAGKPLMSTLRSLAELGEALAATKKKLEQRALIGAYLQSLPRAEAQASFCWSEDDSLATACVENSSPPNRWICFTICLALLIEN